MPAPNNISPCLFLSHSGADTDAARELKRRLLDSPDARAAGLRVWLDKDDLAAGLGWQAQLEKAISEDATAFAVHVGAKGVVNWVESEVRLGLSRATGAPDYPFIPILSRECAGSTALPPFARQYQSVRDPLNDADEFAKLLGAVLRRSPGEKTITLDSPFVGLKAMTEADADRFFGRKDEIAELVAKLKRHRLIAIVADSGAGKSSLAQAGLIPAFRGGGLSDTLGREPDDRLWHVVVMRPRRDPVEGLKRGVTEAAERLGRSSEQSAALRKRIDPADPSETAYAIRCDLPVGKTETLLIVDQFEELLTETAESQREPFVGLLMGLAAAGGFRLVLTLRADHFNLCRPLSSLFEQLTHDGHDAVMRLRRITDKGIAEAVRNPLRLTGHTDASEQDAVIASIRRDVTDRAGDLALVQMALYAMWQKHRTDGVDLLVAYSQVGGVAGALAHEAEHVRTQCLDKSEGALLAPIFIRLVRLGETGGATRRTADLIDFNGPSRTLTARLATEECGRLLLAGEKSVEVAHEALITQWPWLQNTLNEAAGDIRVLDRLMDKARRWNSAGARAAEHVASGAERAEFSALTERRPDWLSGAERTFVAASDDAYAEDERRKREDEQRKQRDAARLRRMARGLAAAAAVLFIAFVGVAWFWRDAQDQAAIARQAEGKSLIAAQEARQAADEATVRRNELLIGQSRFLADRAGRETRRGDAGTALLFALEALPDQDQRPLVQEAENALFNAYQRLQESVVLKGHRGPLNSAAFTPDGRRVVTASEDTTAAVWDAENGKRLAILQGHPKPVRTAAPSPDGRRVLTGHSDGTLQLWDIETGTPIAEKMEGHTAPIRSAIFSPDGRRIATASNDGLRLWEASTGNLVHHLPGFVYGADFSPDGRRLVSADRENTARLLDAQTGNLVATLKQHTAAVRSAAFSPDGRYVVTTSADKTAFLWDLEPPKEFTTLKAHTGLVSSAVFSPDGRSVVTVSDDSTARVWDVYTGHQIVVLEGHEGAVRSAAFSSDGRTIVTASNDHTVRLWNADSGKLAAVFRGHSKEVHVAVFRPERFATVAADRTEVAVRGPRVLTASDDGTARLWSVTTDRVPTILAGHTSAVFTTAFSLDGRRVVTASGDNTARIWDAHTGVETAVLGHDAPVSNAVFSPDDRRVLTASEDATARLWEEGKEAKALKGHKQAVTRAAFSSDGGRVLTASADNTARIWNSHTGQQRAVLEGHTGPVKGGAFSPDGRQVVTASDDKTARVWDAHKGVETAVLGHDAQVSNAVFSPDGRRVATASWDSSARLWNAKSGAETARLEGHESQVYDVAFSRDGERVVTAGADKTARVWNAKTGELLVTLKGHQDSVTAAAFRPDGKQIVTAGADKTARLWDAETGKQIGALEGHLESLSSALFSPDGGRVLTGAADNTARIWRVIPTEALIARSKELAPRCLTAQQRDEAFLDKEPPAWCIESERWPYHTAEWKEWLGQKRAGN